MAVIENRQALDDWPEEESICAYLLLSLVASRGPEPRPLDPPGTVVRAYCPNCCAPSDHELRQVVPGPGWYSFCLTCEGRSSEKRMCDDCGVGKPL